MEFLNLTKQPHQSLPVASARSVSPLLRPPVPSRVFRASGTRIAYRRGGRCRTTLFVGVLTDRSKSIWPSVVAHGGWNALVATGFAVTTLAGDKLPAFAGSTTWVGEFGWLAAVAMLVLGGVTAAWHLSRPQADATA